MKTVAKIMTLEEAITLHRPLPASWKKVRGILKGYNIDPVQYQRKLRKEWDVHIKKQIRLANAK